MSARDERHFMRVAESYDLLNLLRGIGQHDAAWLRLQARQAVGFVRQQLVRILQNAVWADDALERLDEVISQHGQPDCDSSTPGAVTRSTRQTLSTTGLFPTPETSTPRRPRLRDSADSRTRLSVSARPGGVQHL